MVSGLLQRDYVAALFFSRLEASQALVKDVTLTVMTRNGWSLLLARAAADTAVPDGALLRIIKDAVDHGVRRGYDAFGVFGTALP